MKLNEITTIVFDVDGVFTDGSIYVSDNGLNMTRFNVYDGMGCMLLKQIGIDLLILTARHSDAIVERFNNLGINKVFTNVLNKRNFIRDYIKTNNLRKEEVVMVGDDLQDLYAKDQVGAFLTTINAIDEVKDNADYITKKTGGSGAVREICELIIRSKGSSSTKEFDLLIKKSD